MFSVGIVFTSLCEHSSNHPAKEPGNHCATISEGFVTLYVDTHHDGKGNSHGYLQGC